MKKESIPEGFELVWNPITEKEVLRPVVGFSDKFLTPTTFVPNTNEQTVSVTKGKNNSNLRASKEKKYDEFFTSFTDVVKELRNYTSYFKDKTVYCPCDKAFNLGRSSFISYFIAIFRTIGLKKLVCTQYNPNGHGEMKVVDFAGHGIKWEYHGEYEDGTVVDESMIDTIILEGDGSFESEECQKLMQECDIVVTNPPFSKFREFLAQLIRYDKKFIIIGNMNALSYREVFPLVRDNKVWLGMTKPSTFTTPEGEEHVFGNTRWFTNLNHDKRIEELYLSKKYNPSEYQKYFNYDAIDVNNVKNIPNDYYDVIGVPISFIEHYNPNQFEIIGLGISKSGLECGVKPYKDEHRKYRTKVQKRAAVNGDLYKIVDGVIDVPYARILIKRKR